MMMFRRITVLSVLMVLGLAFGSFAQDQRTVDITAQAILARVDEIMEYPKGLIKGKIKHIMPDGRTFDLRVRGFIKKENYLFAFSSRNRGEQLKVLYTLRGEDIWVYNVHSIKLYHKMGIDRYDPLLESNFSFVDLSSADFQSNYTASIEKRVTVKGIESYKLKLLPVFRGSMYGMLTLYVSSDKLIPLRIDYHDRDKAIFKFLTISKVKEKGNRVVPVRYDMMNLRQGTVTIMSFHAFDDEVTFSDDMFRPERLGSN